jgi:uncharacterized protein
LRGAALLGVLFVNLLTEWRVPLLAWITHFHTHDGVLNHAVDWIVGVAFEQKAYAIFGMLFGVGIAAQSRGGRPVTFFLRRFGVLFAMGALHYFLLFSGDILTLYALIGLLLIPARKLGPRALLALSALALIAHAASPQVLAPAGGTDREETIRQTLAIYAHGSLPAIVQYRVIELKETIFPLLAGSALRTVGLALLGMALWRGDWIQRAASHRARLGLAAAPLLVVGGASTAFEAYAAVHGMDLGRMGTLVSTLGVVPLALAYTCALLFAATAPRRAAWVRPLALLGRMTLTNYLVQSVVFGLVFYGYGLGRIGAWGALSTAVLGLAFGLLQIGMSALWLQHHPRGPMESLWRRLSYART